MASLKAELPVIYSHWPYLNNKFTGYNNYEFFFILDEKQSNKRKTNKKTNKQSQTSSKNAVHL